MRVAVILAIVLVGLVALTLADDHSRPNSKDVQSFQTPAEDRKMLLKLGKKLMKFMKKRPQPSYQPAPYYPPPSYQAPQQSYGPPPPPAYRR